MLVSVLAQQWLSSGHDRQCGTMTNRVIDNLFGLACVCVFARVCLRHCPATSVPPLVHAGLLTTRPTTTITTIW